MKEGRSRHKVVEVGPTVTGRADKMRKRIKETRTDLTWSSLALFSTNQRAGHLLFYHSVTGTLTHSVTFL